MTGRRSFYCLPGMDGGRSGGAETTETHDSFTEGDVNTSELITRYLLCGIYLSVVFVTTFAVGTISAC